MDYTLEDLLDFFSQQDEHADFYRQKIVEKFEKMELAAKFFKEQVDRNIQNEQTFLRTIL